MTIKDDDGGATGRATGPVASEPGGTQQRPPDAEEWTFVTRNKPGGRRAHTQPGSHIPVGLSGGTLGPSLQNLRQSNPTQRQLPLLRPPPKTSTNPSTIATLFSRYATPYRASPSCSELRALFRTGAALRRRASGMGPPITDIVVLGLGSLDPDADGGDRRASHVQLAALGAMLEGLADAQQADVGIEDRTSEVHDAVGSNASNETATTVFTVNITYQDPAFTLADTAFLSRPELYLPASLATGSSPVAVQASVVPSPEAFELVAKPRTLLLGIHLYTDVLAAAVATGLPEVYVGTGWEVYEAARWSVASGAPLKRPGRANRRHRRCSGRKNAEYETREDDPSLEDEIKELGWLPKLDPRFGFMEKIPLPATGKEWEDVFEPTGIYWRTDKV